MSTADKCVVEVLDRSHRLKMRIDSSWYKQVDLFHVSFTYYNPRTVIFFCKLL